MTNSFFKSLAVLSSGALMAQFINFVAAPLMTRFFTANDIGILTYITSIAYIFTPVICLRYESTIILEKEKDNVYSLVKLCIYIMLLLSFIVCFGYYIFFFLMEKYEFLKYVVWLVFLLAISGITNICTEYNIREQQYAVLGKVPIYRAIANIVTIITFGMANLSVLGLLIGHTITQIAGLWEQGSCLFYDRNRVFGRKNEELFRLAKEYRKFPLFSVPAIFFNKLSYLSINFFVAELYGIEELAYYALSVKLLGVPLSLISYNMGNIFFEKASKEYSLSGSFSALYIKTFYMLCVLSIPIMGTAYLVAPWFCSFYFGAQWYVAGVYVQIMCILFAVRFIIAPLTSGILVLSKNQIGMICQLCFCVVSIIIYLLAGSLSWSIETYLLAISTGFAIVYAIFGLIVYYLS